MTNTLPKGCYVVLHIGTGPGNVTNALRLVVTDADKRFELSSDTWIKRFDEKLAKRIQAACEPPHSNIGGVKHDRHLYAFIRTIPDLERKTHEGIEELLATIVL